jgi:hypothetical protein
MQAVADVFGDRNVPLAVDTVVTPAEATASVASGSAEPRQQGPMASLARENPLKVIDLAAIQPSATKAGRPATESAVLTVWACPYPELAEVDRGICAMERLMFAELLEQDVRLTACRLDGDPCCRFQTVPLAVPNPVVSG